ncbi:MAG TPA: TIGR03560 family F420-dependent LLM class oxidoreductase [Dehalococcoidia bacterium]|jgi:F420-dependent oxidoreductase-like protein|nr:TIGR03560 family F420-dependent LLM class oxidoreductase [Dehalococcoidia bacterium]
MKIGLGVSGSNGITFEQWRKTIATAERLGFATLVVSDHFVVGEPEDSLEPYLLCAIAARESSTIRFGPLVSPITFRSPWNVARFAAQLDILSGERFVLGLGVGWNAAEHTAFGVPYPSLRERYDRLEEQIEVIKRMWAPGAASYKGRYYKLEKALSLPKPAAGRPPIMIGGLGEKRTLRVVAKYADEWNSGNMDAPSFRKKLAVLKRHCEAEDRDPATIYKSVFHVALIGRTQADLDEATPRMKAKWAPDLEISVRDYQQRLRDGGQIVGLADEVVEQLGELADAGVDEVIFSYYDLDSDAVPEFLASDVVPKL